MKEKVMKKVHEVSEGDVVVISVASNAFSGVACSEVEKRINTTAEKTGITFVVVPNLDGLHILKNEPRLTITGTPRPFEVHSEDEAPDSCPKCGSACELQYSGVQCSNSECGYWVCL